MVGEVKPLSQITEDGIKILCKELGIVNAVRFINQFTVGFGNYTVEREQLFAGMTLDDIVSEIKRMRNP